MHPETSPAALFRRDRLLFAYYALTPVFALLDLAGGVNLRLAGLAARPGLRSGYYLLCLGCALVLWFRPRLSAAVGLLEGAVTIALLVLGVLVPIATLPSADEGTLAAVAASLPEAVANLVLSGSFWLVALYRNPLLSARG